jgi:hypothetical protein
MDDALAPIIIPVGAWNFCSCTGFVGCPGRNPPTPVTILDGATLNSVIVFDSIAIDSQTTTFVIDQPAAPPSVDYTFSGTATVQQTGIGGTFIRVNSAASIGNVLLKDTAAFLTAVGPVLSVTNAGALFGAITLDSSSIQSNTLATIGPLPNGTLGDPNSSIASAQAGVPGGILPIVLTSLAARVNYDDTLVLPPLGATDVQAAIDALKSAIAPFTRLFYVDAGTAIPIPLQNGSVSRPFSSIPAAIAAAALGGGNFTIYVTPGTYAGTIMLPDLDAMAIVGTNAANTIITETPGDHTIKWTPAPTPTLHRFRLSGLTIQNSSPGFDAIHLDGTACAAPLTFLDRSARIVECRVQKLGAAAGAALWIRCAGRFYLDSTFHAVNPGQLALDVSNATTIEASGSTLNGPNSLEWNAAFPRPGTDRNAYSFLNGTTDFYDVPVVPVGFRTTLKGAPIFVVGDTSFILGEAAPIVGPLAIDGTALVGFPAPLYQPVIILNGTFGRASSPGSGNISLVLPPDVGPTASVVDLSKGTFNGSVALSRVALPAGIPPVCFGRGSTFTSSAAGSVSVTTAGAIVLNLDIRDCAIIQAALATAGAGATIDRSKHFISLVGPLPLGPTLVPIVPPLPPPAPGPIPGGYVVSVTPNTLAVISASVPSALKTPVSFTVVAAAAGAGYDFLLSRVE